MTYSHTPAPWRTVTDGISHWVEIDGKIVMVTKTNAEANARLIAASPLMYQALKALMQVAGMDQNDLASLAEPEAFKMAWDAINQVEGKV